MKREKRKRKKAIRTLRKKKEIYFQDKEKEKKFWKK